MLLALVVALACSQIGVIVWVRRAIRQNEDRCETKRQLRDRLIRCQV